MLVAVKKLSVTILLVRGEESGVADYFTASEWLMRDACDNSDTRTFLSRTNGTIGLGSHNAMEIWDVKPFSLSISFFEGTTALLLYGLHRFLPLFFSFC